MRSHPCIESLEGRQLLSAAPGSPYGGFGKAGVLPNYQVLGARHDGYLIARGANNKLALLHPDGTFASNYTGAAPQPIPMQNVQPDGKHLVVKNGVLTRYNKNGTVDKTFGVNGSVSTFAVAQSGHLSAQFTMQHVAVDGNQIFVTGSDGYVFGPDPDPATEFFVERITPNGKIDTTFGNHGIATYSASPMTSVEDETFFLEVGPDHKLYLAADSDLDPLVVRFTEAGKVNGVAFTFGATEDETVGGIAFQHDGKILVLTKDFFNRADLKRYNNDFTADTSFGVKGDVQVAPSFGIGDVQDNTPTALFVRADGVIFVSGTFVGDNLPDVGFSFAYNPGLRANPSAISGRLYNDLNANHKRDANEPALRYWAAYVDTNNDGVWEFGEPISYADYNGYYKLDGLAPGAYTIREISQPGWSITQPAGPQFSYKITLGLNQLVGLHDFGNRFTG